MNAPILPTLDEVATNLREAYQPVEDHFNDTWRVRAQVEFAHGRHFLRYDRLNASRFGFWVDQAPLTEARLELRIQAVGRLQTLWEACQRTQGQLIDQGQAAIQTLRFLTSNLSKD